MGLTTRIGKTWYRNSYGCILHRNPYVLQDQSICIRRCHAMPYLDFAVFHHIDADADSSWHRTLFHGDISAFSNSWATYQSMGCRLQVWLTASTISGHCTTRRPWGRIVANGRWWKVACVHAANASQNPSQKEHEEPGNGQRLRFDGGGRAAIFACCSLLTPSSLMNSCFRFLMLDGELY